jgi:hypothetical protein
MASYRRSARTTYGASNLREEPAQEAATDDAVSQLLGRVEQLEAMFVEEREARLQLQGQLEQTVMVKLDDHGDGLHALMDMLEGIPTVEVVEASVDELRRACEEALEAQTEDLSTLRDELAVEIGALVKSADLEQRLEETVGVALRTQGEQQARTSAELADRLRDLEVNMDAQAVALEAKVREGSEDAAQRLQIMDAKHESLEQTLGIRFDSRLIRVEEVVSSVESRINSELAGFEEKLDLEFARLETLEGSMAKKVSDSSTQLLRVLDKSMTTLDSQMHSQAEVTTSRFDQMQRTLDIGGTMNELRDRIAHAEKAAETLVEPLAARTLALERKTQGLDSTLQEKGGRWDSSQTKVQQVELELERFRKRTDDGMGTLRNRQDQSGKEGREIRSLIETSKMELRRDLELCPKAEEMVSVRESIEEVKENARDMQKRLQDDIRDRAAKCGVDLQTAQRDLSSTLVRCETTLESKISTQEDAITRLEKRQEEATVATTAAIKAELQAFDGTTTAKIEKVVAVAEGNMEATLGGIRGRVERLELLHHDTAEGHRRVEDRCSTLESAMNQRVSEAESKARTSDAMILEGIGRFSEQTSNQLNALEDKVETATTDLKEQVKASTDRLRDNLKDEVMRLDTADSEARTHLMDAQGDLQMQIMREASDIKEMSKAEVKRQDEKISKDINELLEKLTYSTETLRAEVETRVSDQDKQITSDLANVKQDAKETNDRMQQRVTSLEEQLTTSMTDGMTEMKADIASKSAAMDARLVRGLAECEEAIERKAEVGFVKTLEMLLRQDLDETNEAIKQLNEDLGEHDTQMAALEERLEKDEGETSELATDLGFMEAALSTIEMEQADLRAAVSTQIVEEVGACKAESEDKAEVLRLEVQASMVGFKAELDETVVKQMSSRIAQSETAVKARVATMEERVNGAASKTELKTQIGLTNINLDEVSQAVQALDGMMNDDAEMNALTERVEQIDGALRCVLVLCLLLRCFLPSPRFCWLVRSCSGSCQRGMWCTYTSRAVCV